MATVTDLKSLIEQFCSVTGSDHDTARRMLEAYDNNIQASINAYVEDAQPPENGIRAPIPQYYDQLVSQSPRRGVKRTRTARSVFDGFRDFVAETNSQVSSKRSGKMKTLEDLYRPPIDLTHKGSFSSAKASAVSKNLWLLVNVQNTEEFFCQKLNRDVWSNECVRSIIKHSFLLYQIYNDSEEGSKYMQFYSIERWPYISIIDPRTGEIMEVWHQIDALTFCDLATKFLNLHPHLNSSTADLCATSEDNPVINSYVNASEEEQISAAIAASLNEANHDSVRSNCSDDSNNTDLETFTGSDESASEESPHKKLCTHSRTLPNDSLVTLNNSASTKHRNSSKSPKKSSDSSLIKSSKYRKQSKSPSPEVKKVSDDHSDVHSSDSKDLWKKYLGNDDDEKSTLMLRYPDGSREQFSIPCSSIVEALVSYVAEKGYGQTKFELVTNFPRRSISKSDHSLTLTEAKLHPQETIFIQEIV